MKTFDFAGLLYRIDTADEEDLEGLVFKDAYIYTKINLVLCAYESKYGVIQAQANLLSKQFKPEVASNWERKGIATLNCKKTTEGCRFLEAN